MVTTSQIQMGAHWSNYRTDFDTEAVAEKLGPSACGELPLPPTQRSCRPLWDQQNSQNSWAWSLLAGIPAPEGSRVQADRNGT